MPSSNDPLVAALLREREGYARSGLDDRVAQVDEQLAWRGYEQPRTQPPQGRTSEDPTLNTTDEQPRRGRPPGSKNKPRE